MQELNLEAVRRYYRRDCDQFKVKVEGVCDAECQRFRQLFTNWPPNKPKSVIYYLTYYERFSALLKSLKYLEINFNNIFHYPVVIFVDQVAMTEQSIVQQINSATNMSIFLQLVKFRMPAFLDSKLIREESGNPRTVNYRHMCRFQMKTVYEQPILDGLDYSLRLDDDSLITNPIGYDLFKYMKDNNQIYGSVRKTLDYGQNVLGLWEAACNYAAEELPKVEYFDRFPRLRVYFNNFEISDMSFWRSCEYQMFVDYIDRLGGIYYLYWGDAPIKSIGVSMFVPEGKVHEFRDIGYTHKGSDLPFEIPWNGSLDTKYYNI